MTPATQLRAMLALLTPEGAWTKGAYARDHNGGSCGPRNRKAVCWCEAGAMNHTGLSPAAEMAMYKTLPNSFSFMGLSGFNDRPSTTHADILAHIQRAIDYAEDRE